MGQEAFEWLKRSFLKRSTFETFLALEPMRGLDAVLEMARGEWAPRAVLEKYNWEQESHALINAVGAVRGEVASSS
jgi:hypothetical protein